MSAKVAVIITPRAKPRAELFKILSFKRKQASDPVVTISLARTTARCQQRAEIRKEK